ncbi:YbhB/YbcL family Raf kinase inhibitor-like protein [Streptomyces sp. G6]|uniref:YbhB/YbcL family Raf kinase inhibitor-like protein n=1 Tax=Streptomyces sp. G6 TaxID=1178736 RepID=UPI003ED93B93
MELSSAAFRDYAMIPDRYAKGGENVSPPSAWHGVPDEAAELALPCEDPDAPSGTFVHWLVTGIDPHCGELDTEETQPGSQAHRNGYGEQGWGGPKPPEGDEAPHAWAEPGEWTRDAAEEVGQRGRAVMPLVDRQQRAVRMPRRLPRPGGGGRARGCWWPAQQFRPSPARRTV